MKFEACQVHDKICEIIMALYNLIYIYLARFYSISSFANNDCRFESRTDLKLEQKNKTELKQN